MSIFATSSKPTNEPEAAHQLGQEDNAITPLPGEAGLPNVAASAKNSISLKGLLAIGLFVVTVAAMAVVSIQRYRGSGPKAEGGETKRAADRPSAAAAEPRRLELSAASVAASAPAPRIPALLPTAAEVAEPIGVRRTGQPAPTSGGAKSIPPEDAPVMLFTTRPGVVAANSQVDRPSSATEPSPEAEGVEPRDAIASTSRNLQGYQRQLQGLLETLTKTATGAAVAAPGSGTPGAGTPTGAPTGVPTFGPALGPALGPISGGPALGGTPSGANPATTGSLFGGQLPASSTPRVAATMLGNRSLTLPKGTAFTCALKTKVISATSGLVGCQVQRNVFSDDGRVLLIERGSHLDGEYRIASVRPGTVRIPVLWTRVRTPLGVTVDIESPGTGALGESGIDGYVDNRWFERLGAAMLLSLIDDSVKMIIQSQTNDTTASTVVLPSTTANTSKLAEKVLDSTINIPPLIYQNQGGIVGIYVARDVDFSSVYELKPTALHQPREGAP